MAEFASYPSKDALVKEYVGKSLHELRTPALVVDRHAFANNCARMHTSVKQWGASFRAHVKTHKTIEGLRLQLISSSDKTSAIIVSTLVEGWQIARSDLVKYGTVKDILYGLPIAINKIPEVAELAALLQSQGVKMRILLDHIEQVDAIENFALRHPIKWSAFVKVDAGLRRAGVEPVSAGFQELIKTISESSSITIFGFYCHSGNAYASTSLDQASEFLSLELNCVNEAARIALTLITEARGSPFVLSVGSTPTAHAASSPETRAKLKAALNGSLEIHAGNYPMLDLQQLHTSLITEAQISQKILASVLSYYPGRGEHGMDEAICDAGAIALSKDTGPIEGFGEVVSSNGQGWRLGRVSQEHGILVQSTYSKAKQRPLKVGSMIEIVGQHACLIAAAHPWFYVVDSGTESGGSEVEDIWVPCKGW